MMIDAVVGYVNKKIGIGKLAKKIGKSEDEIYSAIKEGKKGSISVAKRLGINKAIAQGIYDKFGYLADKIPLVGRPLLDKEFAKILPQLEDDDSDEPSATRRPSASNSSKPKTKKNKSKFDKNKYF